MSGVALEAATAEGAAVVLVHDGTALPAAVTREILAAAIAWGEAWRLFDRAIPDGRQYERQQVERDLKFTAAQKRLYDALRPTVSGM